MRFDLVRICPTTALLVCAAAFSGCSTSSDDDVLMWARGRAHLENGYYAQALRSFERLAQMHPNRPEPLVYYAMAARRGENFDLAQSSIDRALEIDPTDIAATWQRGLLRNHLRQYESAVPDLERSVAAAPEMATARYQLGVALRHLGDERATGLFREAVERDPLLFQAHYALYLLLRERDPTAAAEQLNLLEDLRAQLPDWYRNDQLRLEAGALSQVEWADASQRELPPNERNRKLRLQLVGVRNRHDGAGCHVEIWGPDGFYVRAVTQPQETTIAIGAWDRIEVLRVQWPNGIVQDALDLALDFDTVQDAGVAALTLKEEMFIKGSWGGTRVE